MKKGHKHFKNDNRKYIKKCFYPTLDKYLLTGEHFFYKMNILRGENAVFILINFKELF